jgi:hypothetical protein
MLSFLSEAREASGSETTRLHHAARRLAARGARVSRHRCKAVCAELLDVLADATERERKPRQSPAASDDRRQRLAISIRSDHDGVGYDI